MRLVALSSLNVKVKGERSRSLGTKNEKVRHFVRESSSGVRSSYSIFFGSGPWDRHPLHRVVAASCYFSEAVQSSLCAGEKWCD